MRIAIGIPTLGRAAILGQALDDLARQSRQPDRIVVCCARPEDVPERARQIKGFECLLSEPGSSRQRNRIIDHVADCDIVLFLDDDFVMRDDYLAVTEALFAARPGAIITTGTVVADGIMGKGLTFAEARAMLDAEAACRDPLGVTPVANGYGCNMAMRLSALRRTGIRFDESLPLYAWQEDAELSCRLAAHGEILRVEGARGVHLGVKMGRSVGIQLGYSQVINPLYIARRVPAYTMRRALSHLACNLVANVVRSARPEPWVDRRGRLRGNMLGLMDALRGRLTPERAVLLGAPRGAAAATAYSHDFRALGTGFDPGRAANQNTGRQ
jgi:GT2 family glycosyltransferase